MVLAESTIAVLVSFLFVIEAEGNAGNGIHSSVSTMPKSAPSES